MKKMTASQIRKMFLDFFESKGHMIEPGVSLVPFDDPTLLWIGSGVAALKKYFDGSIIPQCKRIANSQRSIRANDIENVGHTARHHTFFEMLGNFSIGDYFREEALAYAWELMTSPEWFAFDPAQLYITIHPTDQESYDTWIKLGVDPNHIIKEEGNFWEIGAGPCGPNTEIFYDRGIAYDPDNIGLKLLEEDIENDRYIEVWNVVLSQYNSDPELERHEYEPLPSQNIDTGMGLERMACVLQEVETNFETDLFMPIIDKIEQLSGNQYEGAAKVSFKIIADHARTVTFAVADGAMLSNEGRGYVLRRLLRRAVRHGKNLGVKGAFLYQLVSVIADIMKDFYPTVAQKTAFIQGIIKDEEERFLRTLADGEKRFNEMANTSKEIIGTDAFMLYDTYGFPFELTLELAEECGLTVDKEGFEAAMEAQKSRARNARSETDSMVAQNEVLLNFTEKSEFIDGYEGESKVILLLDKDGQVVDELWGDGQFILDKTPYYATSGGQVTDEGFVIEDELDFRITDVTKAPHGQHLHTAKMYDGVLKVGDTIEIWHVISSRRRFIERNHTATHLLHQALKDVLGNYHTSPNQAGSLVNDTYLRFDFNHQAALKESKLKMIEDIVNEKIQKKLNVKIEEMTLDEAKAKGATALFGEKYNADQVRVVTLREEELEEDYSIELCGGTHVKNTSEIGLFKIISESGIGAGIRRIEAVTSKAAFEYLNTYETRINNLATSVKAKPNNLEMRIETLTTELSDVKRELESLKTQMANSKIADLVNQVQVINGINVLTARIDGVAMNDLKTMIDEFKQKLESAVIVLASTVDDKVSLACGVTADYVEQGLNAGKIVKEIAIICGGNGGGRPDMATAGAQDASKIEAGFEKVATLFENHTQ